MLEIEKLADSMFSRVLYLGLIDISTDKIDKKNYLIPLLLKRKVKLEIE